MMKFLMALAVIAPAVVLVGCKKTEPAKPAPPKESVVTGAVEPGNEVSASAEPAANPAATDANSDTVKLVSLKVPNMT